MTTDQAPGVKWARATIELQRHPLLGNLSSSPRYFQKKFSVYLSRACAKYRTESQHGVAFRPLPSNADEAERLLFKMLPFYYASKEGEGLAENDNDNGPADESAGSDSDTSLESIVSQGNDTPSPMLEGERSMKARKRTYDSDTSDYSQVSSPKRMPKISLPSSSWWEKPAQHDDDDRTAARSSSAVSTTIVHSDELVPLSEFLTSRRLDVLEDAADRCLTDELNEGAAMQLRLDGAELERRIEINRQQQIINEKARLEKQLAQLKQLHR